MVRLVRLHGRSHPQARCQRQAGTAAGNGRIKSEYIIMGTKLKDLKIGEAFQITSVLNPSIVERLVVVSGGKFVVEARSLDFIGMAYISPQRTVKRIS